MHAQGKSDAKANSLTWHTDVKEALVISNKETNLYYSFTGRLVRMVSNFKMKFWKQLISKKWPENVVLVELDFQEKSSNARDAKSE
jgi:hypothetical protein